MEAQMSVTQKMEAEAKADRDILLKYVKGRVVDVVDEPILRRWETIGLVHFGFSFGKRESQASLTESGKRLLGLAS